MEFYNDPVKVDAYEKMCVDYDGSKLYQVLHNHLPQNSTVLELGCGLGLDIEKLKNNYSITGSDLSDEFLMRCKKKFKDLPFLKLDAVAIETDITFECIFSNKVLHHLTLIELEKSIQRQQRVLKHNGIFAHTFWLGDKEFEMEGMLFVYHNREKLLKLISQHFTILQSFEYKEFEENDSIFIVAQNNKSA